MKLEVNDACRTESTTSFPPFPIPKKSKKYQIKHCQHRERSSMKQQVIIQLHSFVHGLVACSCRICTVYFYPFFNCRSQMVPSIFFALTTSLTPHRPLLSNQPSSIQLEPFLNTAIVISVFCFFFPSWPRGAKLSSLRAKKTKRSLSCISSPITTEKQRKNSPRLGVHITFKLHEPSRSPGGFSLRFLLFARHAFSN